MKGITLGTYRAWCKEKGLPEPDKAALRSIPDAHVAAIYHERYWLASGADEMAWPDCLAVFDTAVLHGVGAAQTWRAETGGDASAIVARRLRSYTRSANWSAFGAGWVNRASDLLTEAA